MKLQNYQTIFSNEQIRKTALAFMASLLIAASAQIRVPVPFSPVPVTMQTLTVLIIGALLGQQWGTIAILIYLMEGLAGLPVFAGMSSGVGVLIGPTGGYLLGFLAAAYLAGWIFEKKWAHSPPGIFLALIISNATIYIIGLPWLAVFVGSGQVLALGLYPFILGDIAKIFLGAALLQTWGKQQRLEN